MTKAKAADLILGTSEAWEDGRLGQDVKHARKASEDRANEINESLAMQMISIRLPKCVVDDFKAIASLTNIGYQPLMRQALVRFAQGEMRRLVREFAAESSPEPQDDEPPARKVA